MDKEELKELIQAVYEEYPFANFNLHFVNEVEPHKVYEIKNNRINNVLKDTTLVSVNAAISNEEMKSMLLYGVDVKERYIYNMIESTANRILSDMCKVRDRDWLYANSNPVDIEMTITNWEFQEEKTEIGIVYKLRFEVA